MTVATRLQTFTFNVPAQRQPNNPVSASLSWGNNMVHSVQIRTPAGHRGTTGLRFVWNGSYILPWSGSGDWLIMDDEIQTFPIETEIDTHLLVSGYNTDIQAHAYYLRILYTPIVLVTTLPPLLSVVPVF